MSKYFREGQLTNWPNKIFLFSLKKPSEKQTRDIMQTNDVTLILVSHQREAITCLMNCYLSKFQNPQRKLHLSLRKENIMHHRLLAKLACKIPG